MENIWIEIFILLKDENVKMCKSFHLLDDFQLIEGCQIIKNLYYLLPISSFYNFISLDTNIDDDL